MRSDKNGQTANKGRDHSTLTLNTLSHCFPRKVKRAGGGREGGRATGRQAGRQADRKRVGERRHEREMRR